MLLAVALLITNAVLQTLQAPHLYYVVLNITGPDIVHHGLRYTHYEFAIIGIFWRVWWATVVFVALAYIGCWMTSVYTCHPPSDYFQFGKCTKPIDQTGSVISIVYSTVVDILTDLLIMFLPLRIIWQAKINMQQKVGLVIFFCLGFLIIAAAIVRAFGITGKAYSDQAGLAVWSVAESSISIIVGCLPPFRAIISTKSNTTQSPDGSADIPPSSYDHIPSVGGKTRSDAASCSQAPLPLQDLGPYTDNLDYGIHARDVASQEELRGDIKMIQEFVSL
ncbi:hypothetical protein N7475_008661 [Penicillium sp. IBT 31633x]|nr:hypothetical protein N7475_008661 [Penicillium sp. IBT 31633x]